jgi:hypothetical protein
MTIHQAPEGFALTPAGTGQQPVVRIPIIHDDT